MRLYNRKKFRYLFEAKFDKLFDTDMPIEIVKLVENLKECGVEVKPILGKNDGQSWWEFEYQNYVIFFDEEKRSFSMVSPSMTLIEDYNLEEFLNYFKEKFNLTESKFDKVFDVYPEEPLNDIIQLMPELVFSKVGDRWTAKIKHLAINFWRFSDFRYSFDIWDSVDRQIIFKSSEVQEVTNKLKEILSLNESKFEKVFGLEMPEILEELNLEFLEMGLDFNFIQSGIVKGWWIGKCDDIEFSYDERDTKFTVMNRTGSESYQGKSSKKALDLVKKILAKRKRNS